MESQKAQTAEVWDGIRVGRGNIGFLRWKGGAPKPVRQMIRLKARLTAPILERPLTYEISISARRGVVKHESLRWGITTIFDTEKDSNFANSPQ